MSRAFRTAFPVRCPNMPFTKRFHDAPGRAVQLFEQVSPAMAKAQAVLPWNARNRRSKGSAVVCIPISASVLPPADLPGRRLRARAGFRCPLGRHYRHRGRQRRCHERLSRGCAPPGQGRRARPRFDQGVVSGVSAGRHDDGGGTGAAAPHARKRQPASRSGAIQHVAPDQYRFSRFDRDEPIPELSTNGHQSSLARWIGKTPREVAVSQSTKAGIDFTGTVDHVAGMMQEIMEEVGGGFLFFNATFDRRYVMEVCDGLVPELQRRGLTRTRYAHRHLKDNLLEF